MRNILVLSALIRLLWFASVVVASGDVAVQRLVSRHYAAGNELEKRGSGYANGGSASNSGKDSFGQLKNKSNYEVSFFHINDVHAHLDEFRPSGSSCSDPSKGCVGGYPRVKSVLQKQRPKKNSLFLNAGDEFQGTLFYNLYKGEAISSVLNQLGFDAMTLGNHEFDDGDDLLANFVANLTFPVISSNIHTTHRKLAKNLTPFKVWPEHQLAVLALTTEATKTISRPGNGTTFEDPVDAAVRTVKFIQRYHRNVKRIVALTHIGYDKDIELARRTSGISLIIGGHSHTLLNSYPSDPRNTTTVPNAKGPYPTIVDNQDGEEVFVVTSYRWGEYLGYIDVEWDKKGRIVKYEGAPIHLTNTPAANETDTRPEDANLKANVKKWEQGFAEYAATVVGLTELPLDETTCQAGECTLGDLTGDFIAAMTPSNYTSPYNNHGPDPGNAPKLAGAIMNAGGIRSSFDGPGNITLQQVLECFPFGNAVTELTFTSRELWRIFEGIVSDVNLDNQLAVTSFVQVSGSIRFVYDESKAVGERLVSLTVANGEVVEKDGGSDPDKKWLVATIDYLAGGGDSFWVPKSSGDFITLNTIDEVLVAYFKALGAEQGRSVGSVKVELDGRIQKV